jgi:hypothetical protein
MQNGENDGTLVLCDVEDAVGKPPGKRSPYLSVDNRRSHWVALDERECRIERAQEFLAETFCLIFVPVVGLTDILLGLGTKQELRSQRRLLILALTTSQDDPVPGSARYAERRLSSSCRCASVSATLEESAATESQISCASWIRSATLSSRIERKSSFPMS